MSTTTTTASPTDLNAKLSLYRSQLALRLFEQRAYDLFLENLVKGTSHLSLGQEAIASGFAAAMRPTDWTFATYRGHAHTLARGVPMTPVLAELLGRSNGLMAGKGGSMHLTSVEHGVMGSYAIIGAHLPIACGAAWSAQYRGTEQVAKAVIQMEQLTQKAAASAEQSASASTELTAQASALKDVVDRLTEMVGGERHRTASRVAVPAGARLASSAIKSRQESRKEFPLHDGEQDF